MPILLVQMGNSWLLGNAVGSRKPDEGYKLWSVKSELCVSVCVCDFNLCDWFVVRLLSPVWLFVTPWTTAHQASLSFTISQSLLRLMSFESVMPSNHLIFFCPQKKAIFSSCPQSFLASGSFPVSRFFASGGQSIGASASVLPVHIQSWFSLGLKKWFDLLAVQGSLTIFSSTTIQKHQFFST